MRHSLSEINEINKTGICSVCGFVKLHSRNPKSLKAKGRWACSISQIEKKRLKRSGLLPEDYKTSQLKIQNCEICGKTIKDNKKKLSVDHCHKTGKFRGMLCFKCNIGLGMFNDNINIIKKSIIYLKKRGK